MSPNVIVVTIIQVEGADQAALMDQTKKAQAIWKDLGVPAFRTWQSTLAGTNTGSVVYVTEYDDSVAWAKGTQKLAASEKWQKFIQEFQAWGKSTTTSSSMLMEITP